MYLLRVILRILSLVMFSLIFLITLLYFTIWYTSCECQHIKLLVLSKQFKITNACIQNAVRLLFTLESTKPDLCWSKAKLQNHKLNSVSIHHSGRCWKVRRRSCFYAKLSGGSYQMKILTVQYVDTWFKMLNQ